MSIFGVRGIALLLAGVLLAVYINYPEPTNISKHLAKWEQTASNTKIIKGHRIFFKDEYGRKPDAPVLLCLHGFPSSSFDWVKVWPALLDKFSRVIAADFLGLGLSDKPLDHKYSIMEQADIVEQLLDKVKVASVHILAHDYGDTVAQELLARYEDRQTSRADGITIRSVTLLNGGIFPETNFSRFLQKALLVPYVEPVISRLTNMHLFSRGFGEVFGPETQPTAEEFADFWALVRKNNGHLVLGKLLQYIPERSANKNRWTGVLQTTSVPVHVIYGPADPVNPPGFVDFYKKTVPNPSIAVLHAYIGHYPQWEDPARCMNEFFAFLKTLPFHDRPMPTHDVDKENKGANQEKQFKVKDTKPRKRSETGSVENEEQPKKSTKSKPKPTGDTKEDNKLKAEEKLSEQSSSINEEKKSGTGSVENEEQPKKSTKSNPKPTEIKEDMKLKANEKLNERSSVDKKNEETTASTKPKNKNCGVKPRPHKPDLLDDFGKEDVIEMELKRKDDEN